MRRILLTVLVGALVAVAPAAAQPFPLQRDPDRGRDRDRDHDRDRDRGPSPRAQALVTGWSMRFFGMGSDEASLDYWGGQLDRGATPDQVEAAILGHSSYYAHVGGTPRAFVHDMFRGVTGREPSRREFDFWMDRLFRIGGDAPSDEDRTNLAYEMVRRYPQAVPAPDHDDDYDYRKPDYRRDRP